MNYRPGDTAYESFPLHNIAGTLSDADSLPTAILRRNGAGSTAVTVNHNSAGDYTATVAIPLTWTGGDKVEIVVSYAMGGISRKRVLSLGTLDRTQQDVARVMYRASGKVHMVSASALNDNNDGLSFETAKLTVTASLAASIAGDVVLCGPGIFSEANVFTGKSYTALYGAGMDLTRVQSPFSGNGTFTILREQSNFTLCDINIEATGSGVNVYSMPIGDNSQSITGVVHRRVKTVGDTDGRYYIGPATWMMDINGVHVGGWDNWFISNGAVCDLFNFHGLTNAPNICSPASNRSIASYEGSKIRLWGGEIVNLVSNTDLSRTTGVVLASGSTNGGFIELRNAFVRTNATLSTDGTVHTLTTNTSPVVSTIEVSDSGYDPSLVSGNIVARNTPSPSPVSYSADDTTLEASG